MDYDVLFGLILGEYGGTSEFDWLLYVNILYSAMMLNRLLLT